MDASYLLSCFLFLLVADAKTRINPKNPYYNRTGFIKELILKDNLLTKPDMENDNVTVVTVNIYVSSIDEVNEQGMSYKMTMMLRQQWVDDRLSYTNVKELNMSSIPLDDYYLKMIWVPPLFFPNDRDGTFHDMAVPNRLMRIYPNGSVLFEQRIGVDFSCNMDLLMFPFDIQKCAIIIESFSLDPADMIFEWEELPDGTLAVQVDHELSIAQYDFVRNSINLTSETRDYFKTGQFSRLKATFVLRRNVGFYLMQYFMPSFLIVILAWINFFINHQATPARVTLGIVTILTITTMTTGLSQNLPRVSYVKGIDIWMSACLAFVFIALVEYAAINVIVVSSAPKHYQVVPISPPKTSGRAASAPTSPAMNNGDGDFDFSLVPFGDTASPARPRRPKAKRFRLKPPKSVANFDSVAAYRLEMTARIVYPIAFGFFNIVYWWYYWFSEDTVDYN